MTYLSIAGFTLFTLAVGCLVWQEVKHHNHVLEMREWAVKMVDLAHGYQDLIDSDTETIESLEARVTALTEMRDYLVACNTEIYQGYIDAAHTVANMTASVEALSDELDDARIQHAKAVLGGTTISHVSFEDDVEEINPFVPVDYYLPDQDQG